MYSSEFKGEAQVIDINLENIVNNKVIHLYMTEGN